LDFFFFLNLLSNLEARLSLIERVKIVIEE